MESFRLTTPVVFIIFNRPDTTKRVFEEIRKAKPDKLLVIADGPRANRIDEDAKCKEVRAIIEKVDWDCEVIKNYSDINLGCKKRVSSGLDWVFDTVEEAIILEDDCLPHPTFFRYCQELLGKYRYDERIMLISGNNFSFGAKRTNYSYFFSRYPHIWGWASWRRSWKYYDVTMKAWPEIHRDKWLNDIFCDKNIFQYWNRIFENTYMGRIDTWDYQLFFACFIQSKLNIMPTVNLISNIGFGSEATHTLDSHSRLSNMEIEAMMFPLSHPTFMVRDTIAEKVIESELFSIKSLSSKIVNKISRILR